MKSLYVREQKRYTEKDLCEIFGLSREIVVRFIRRLKEFGVLKAVKKTDLQKDMSELLVEDIEVSDVENGDYLYVFTFVGVIVVAGIVLKCYPKYLFRTKEPKEELHQILKVLEKYNSKKQIINLFNESNEGSAFNLLAVLLFLLHDYYENGSYSKNEDIIETNGTGEILWDKTINESFTFLSNKRPYYIDLQTRKRTTDDYDYYKRLHECIVTRASDELKEADLLDLFDITPVDLSDEYIEDFGDKDYILYRIEQELNIQYNTRKQLVLKALYAYIDHMGKLQDSDGFSLFGTNSFNLVWESICADIMNNCLGDRLGTLRLPLPLKDSYNRKSRLIDLIEKPFWSATGNVAADTLIPDLITISVKDGKWQFIIFDAKYYTPHLEAGCIPESQPGIESITKQYLYQLAYQDFIKDHGFTDVRNCFLMPTEEDMVVNRGIVSMKMLSNIGLKDIEVRMIPARMAYTLYLSEKRMDINLLGL